MLTCSLIIDDNQTQSEVGKDTQRVLLEAAVGNHSVENLLSEREAFMKQETGGHGFMILLVNKGGSLPAGSVRVCMRDGENDT